MMWLLLLSGIAAAVAYVAQIERARRRTIPRWWWRP